jgi:hypothetical protein
VLEPAARDLVLVAVVDFVLAFGRVLELGTLGCLPVGVSEFAERAAAGLGPRTSVVDVRLRAVPG